MAAGYGAHLLAAVICFALAVCTPHAAGDAASLESVPDLLKAMHLNIESFPCVRLLNLSGEIDCSNSGSKKIIAPIVRFSNSSNHLVQPSTVLLPLDKMSDFFLSKHQFFINSGCCCFGCQVDGGGICVVSTTRYVPAYSTRVRFEGNVWHVLPANSSDPMSAADPVCTESFWNTISLRVYAVQSAAYDWIVLLARVSITAASYLATIIGRTYISKFIKRD